MALKHLRSSSEDIRGQRIDINIWHDENFSKNLDSWDSNFNAIIKHTLRVLDRLISKTGRYPADTTPTHNLNIVFLYDPNYPIASVSNKKTKDHPKNKFAEVTVRFNFSRANAGTTGKSAITHELLHPISKAHDNEDHLKSECKKQMRTFIADEQKWDREFRSVSQQYFSLIEHDVDIDFNEFYRKYFHMGERLRKKFHNTFADAGLAIIGLRLNAFDFLDTEIKFDKDRVDEALVLMREFAMLKVKMTSLGVPRDKYEAIVQFVGYVIAIYTLPVHAITLLYIDFGDYATRAGLSQRQITRLEAMRGKLDEVIAFQQQVRYQYMRTKTKRLFETFLRVYLDAIRQLVHDDILYRDIATDRDEMKAIFHASKLHAIKKAQSIFFNQYSALLEDMKN